MLTLIFVMAAEIMIFVPSVARFRIDYLQARLESGQLASLALLGNEMIEAELEEELLRNAEVYNVVLWRNEVRQLALSSPIPGQIYRTYDLQETNPLRLIKDAFETLLDPNERIIRIMGEPVKQAGQLIEVTISTAPLRELMIDYGKRIFYLSAFISFITATLLFIFVRILIVRPINRVVDAIALYAKAPEDTRRIIIPSAGVCELHTAELALNAMQTELTSALKQKERLAQLGGAVAKISHDLRNILTTAQLFTDLIDCSNDPAVSRSAPKLVNAISRAVNLCETTLAFGKAEEPAPTLKRVPINTLIDDIVEAEALSTDSTEITFETRTPPSMIIRADEEQIHRVISNIIRNAKQALTSAKRAGTITVIADEDDQNWKITIKDDGPGLPPKAREHLFAPFQGSTRKGGTGLGLTISAELVRGHGGDLILERTDENGTEFSIYLPKEIAFYDAKNL